MPTDAAARLEAIARTQASLLAAVIDHCPPGDLLAGDAQAQARGLQVYRQAYLARLREGLADNYPAFARALGDAAFARLADAYAGAHPPTATSLRAYGDRLDEFLARPPLDEHGQPLLPHPALRDLARMDRALRDAFDAADATPLQAADLAGLPATAWPALQLRLLPSASRIRQQWAVEAAWHALSAAPAGEEPVLPPPEPHAHTVLVWRPYDESRWRSLDPEEDALLDRIALGDGFGALGDWLAVQRGDAGAATTALVGWLQQWLADGCLAALPAET